MLHILAVVLLTFLTQIGGVVYLVALIAIKRTTPRRRLKRLGVFVVLYLLATFLLVPWIAPLFGREPIKGSPNLEPHTYFYKLANRNYVTPALQVLLQEVATNFAQQHPGLQVHYLDANFPFFDGFPLLPHLSHKDGKKIDVCLVYEDANGQLSNLRPSVSGYGIYEGPRPNEYDQTAVCKKKGYWPYDFPKYLSLGHVHKELRFSERGTRDLALAILKEPRLQKLFIEPHLKARLRLTHNKVRFHGCHAVRHDDHIHLQVP
ncbi:MAG TPA: hypothetical protein PKW08_05665 [Flavobacteriaceae bacterium]|nr:hypothetical protein [Flavobacteriaceae bacterium]HQU21060.1 hypothetical protein [Flavobacteriaceae bacterium]HQU65961.1 hypothetical protein [Flavobacteriaceae bacterium]HRW43527.1 hypothetical protein [Flavobacteriaceae bacterium]